MHALRNWLDSKLVQILYCIKINICYIINQAVDLLYIVVDLFVHYSGCFCTF